MQNEKWQNRICYDKRDVTCSHHKRHLFNNWEWATLQNRQRDGEKVYWSRRNLMDREMSKWCWLEIWRSFLFIKQQQTNRNNVKRRRRHRSCSRHPRGLKTFVTGWDRVKKRKLMMLLNSFYLLPSTTCVVFYLLTNVSSHNFSYFYFGLGGTYESISL